MLLRVAVVAFVGMSGALGCRALAPEVKDESLPLVSESETPSLLPWKDDGPKVGLPTQIVATWTDTVLQQSGKGASRGFGGRLYFYGSKDPQPIAVEGQLVVYAFDETGRKPTDNKPTKRYVFPPAQFALHQSQSDLGVSYSFWLPWDKMSGKQTDVSLIARFEPVEGGALVVSDQSKVRLPGQFDGPSVTPEKQIAQRITPVQTVSHEALIQQAMPGKNAAKQSVETTTIQLPQNHRLLRSKAGGNPEAAAQADPVVGPRQTTVKYLTPGESIQRRLGAR